MKQLAFPESEFRARVKRLQAVMEQRGLGVMLIYSQENMYYLTGYQTSGYFAYQALAVPVRGDPALLVRGVERTNADHYSYLDGTIGYRDGEDLIAATVRLIDSVAGDNSTIGIEKRSWFLTVDRYEALCERIVGRPIVDASMLVEELRLIKSEAEIAYVRQAAGIAEAAVRAGIETIHEGVTEAQVAAAVVHAQISAGGEYTGLPSMVPTGYRTGLVHANWSQKVIAKGETAVMQLSGCAARYHATTARTVCVGEPTPDVRRAVDILLSAGDAVLAALRPGASSRAIDALVRQPVRESGLRAEYHSRTGYSIGIGFPPRTGEWDTRDFVEYSDWEVKEGMVFHCLTSARGVFISETVLVTKDGAERLTTLPRQLFVAN